MAHQIAWERTFGPIPEGLHVLHRCDVQPCINPEHLFIGTQRDNVQDMIQKGRMRRARGEQNAKTVLTDSEVAELRSRHAAGVSGNELAQRFGVSYTHVRRLVLGLQRRAHFEVSS